jgi:MFS family permease
MLPAEFAALFEALRFSDARTDGLRRLSDQDWRKLLPLCDRAQLTLPLGDTCPGVLPEPVRRRIESDFEKTARRGRTIVESFREVAGCMDAAGLPYVVLKGFANSPAFFPDPYRRVQYDLDLYLPLELVTQARQVMLDIGYRPLGGMEEFPTDHLPVMIRKTGWQWRGDFFDSDIPLSIDLHFRLWDKDTEGFNADGWEQFWPRRMERSWEGLRFAAFCDADLLGYHCLHLLRHLLRGSLRLSHVYELAYFLHQRETDTAFWHDWSDRHSDGLRRLEAIPFAIAQRWFGCRLALKAAEEVASLPAPVVHWLATYAASPVQSLLRPNKHELWLHLSLLDTWTPRWLVTRRRLFPTRMPRTGYAAFVPDHQLTGWIRWRSRLNHLVHVTRRLVHHTRVLPSVALHGARWLWRESELGRLGPAYWRFLGATSFFNLGAFVFLIVYNLHLLDLGYREDLLGVISGAMTAGSIAGTLPAGRLAARAGLRSAFVSCFVMMALVSAGRVLATGQATLVAFAFLAGVAFSVFAVAVAPAIAQLSSERARPRAFSIFFAVGIGLGICGGLLGGRLPAWLGSKQAALLVGCGLMAAAAVPALTLRFPAAPVSERRVYPKGPFIRRFLPVIAAWSLATGAFNPFFNTYFARQVGATVEQIGSTHAAGQAAQVFAILLAPHLLRRAGLVRGVAVTQLAAGLFLAALALIPAPGVVLAATAYAGYMAFHYMGEPGLFSLLMNNVPPGQRSGASSLNFLAIFTAQAIAAAVAGAVVTATGYAPVVTSAALLALIAALLMWRLLADYSAE